MRFDPSHQEHEVQKLFLEHAPMVRGFIQGLLSDPHRANDVFQEVFLTVNAKADQFCLGTNFLAWARAIARLKILEHCRREKRLDANRVVLRPEVMEMLFQTAGDLDETWELRCRALNRCLGKVTDLGREVLDLRYVEGLVPTQIALKLSRNVDAVNLMLIRIRKSLRDCVRRQIVAEDGAI